VWHEEEIPFVTKGLFGNIKRWSQLRLKNTGYGDAVLYY
jgi:hypothetical protein